MNESVSTAMFKIWSDSQSALLKSLSEDIKAVNAEQKETNANIRDVIDLLKDDINTTKAILNQHIIEYDKHCSDDGIRFKNIFQRQNKIDQILIDRAPAWVVFKSFRKGASIFITAVIIISAGYFAVLVGLK